MRFLSTTGQPLTGRDSVFTTCNDAMHQETIERLFKRHAGNIITHQNRRHTHLGDVGRLAKQLLVDGVGASLALDDKMVRGLVLFRPMGLTLRAFNVQRAL